MKPSKSDYLSITAALVAILLCGYGIGFLVGERTTRNRLDSGVQAGENWSAATVERLKRDLDLTDAQAEAVEREVLAAETEIGMARRDAIRSYHISLLKLHERLLPHLDPKQRKMIEDSSKILKKSLDKPQDARER